MTPSKSVRYTPTNNMHHHHHPSRRRRVPPPALAEPPIVGLPRHPSQDPLRPPSNAVLPDLVHEQKTYPKRHRQEPILDWHRRRVKDSLELRYVEPEERHSQRKGNCGEEVYVLCLSVEQGRMLEDGQPPGADGEEIEPLPVICQKPVRFDLA